jgi:hypothetical protein
VASSRACSTSGRGEKASACSNTLREVDDGGVARGASWRASKAWVSRRTTSHWPARAAVSRARESRSSESLVAREGSRQDADKPSRALFSSSHRGFLWLRYRLPGFLIHWLKVQVLHDPRCLSRDRRTLTNGRGAVGVWESASDARLLGRAARPRGYATCCAAPRFRKGAPKDCAVAAPTPPGVRGTAPAS